MEKWQWGSYHIYGSIIGYKVWLLEQWSVFGACVHTVGLTPIRIIPIRHLF